MSHKQQLLELAGRPSESNLTKFLTYQLWLRNHFDNLTQSDMAQAIEQLRPYIESTAADESLAFLKQWDGLLKDNWHALRLIYLQSEAKVKPYQDEFNGRYTLLLELLTHVEFAVENFELGNSQTRQELNITSGQFRAIQLTAIELKDTLRKIKPWVQGRGWAYPYK